MTTISAKPVDLALVNSSNERLRLRIYDTAGDPADATSLTFSLRSLDDNVLYEEDFIAAPSRIVRTAVGEYYFPLGTAALVDGVNPETGCLGELIAVWTADIGGAGDTVVQKIWIVSTYAVALIADLRLQIDKSVKAVSDDPDAPCFLGYTDAMLMQFLLNGLSIWNLYEPYPTFISLEQFPSIYRQGLIESALYVGLASQELFAVDTDVPNYSAQGAAFVIQHQPQLGAIITRIAQRLDKLIPIAKLKLVRSGTAHVQSGANYRLTQMIQMAPAGALFRNMFVAGA